MGFGVGLGPRVFRVRVGTRGFGVSSGVGPFSVYAHTGRGLRRRRTTTSRWTSGSTSTQAAPVYLPGDMTTVNLSGANAGELVPTGSGEVVAQLNGAQKWITGWSWTAVICALVSIGVAWLLIPTIVALALAIFGLVRRRVLLDYEIDSDLRQWFDTLIAGWPSLAETQGKWRVQSRTRLHRTHHQKVNAGARHLVTRHAVVIRTKTPFVLKASIPVPTIKAQRHALMFLPDRVLVKTGWRWSDVDYSHLDIRLSQGRFIENGSTPRDGVKVGETWQYTNVNGGPDRRFKNNRTLPVMLYSEISLTSAEGLGWDLSLSRHDVATWWAETLRSRPETPPVAST